jgi:hypothetical protein
MKGELGLIDEGKVEFENGHKAAFCELLGLLVCIHDRLYIDRCPLHGWWWRRSDRDRGGTERTYFDPCRRPVVFRFGLDWTSQFGIRSKRCLNRQWLLSNSFFLLIFHASVLSGLSPHALVASSHAHALVTNLWGYHGDDDGLRCIT